LIIPQQQIGIGQHHRSGNKGCACKACGNGEYKNVGNDRKIDQRTDRGRPGYNEEDGSHQLCPTNELIVKARIIKGIEKIADGSLQAQRRKRQPCYFLDTGRQKANAQEYSRQPGKQVEDLAAPEFYYEIGHFEGCRCELIKKTDTLGIE